MKTLRVRNSVHVHPCMDVFKQLKTRECLREGGIVCGRPIEIGAATWTAESLRGRLRHRRHFVEREMRGDVLRTWTCDLRHLHTFRSSTRTNLKHDFYTKWGFNEWDQIITMNLFLQIDLKKLVEQLPTLGRYNLIWNEWSNGIPRYKFLLGKVKIRAEIVEVKTTTTVNLNS